MTNNQTYNKKYHKEFLEMVKDKEIPNELILQAYKLNRKFPNWCTPCEDCDNCNCEETTGRVLWCPNRM